MYEYEGKAAISPLKAEAQAKLRERAEAVTGVTAQVLRYVAEHLFDPDLSTGEALRRKLSVSRRGVKLAGQVLGEAVRDVVTGLRIGIARKFLAEHPEAPVWRVAAEVGLPEHRKFVRYYKHHTGERLSRCGKAWSVASRTRGKPLPPSAVRSYPRSVRGWFRPARKRTEDQRPH